MGIMAEGNENPEQGWYWHSRGKMIRVCMLQLYHRWIKSIKYVVTPSRTLRSNGHTTVGTNWQFPPHTEVIFGFPPDGGNYHKFIPEMESALPQ
jgi:hypothetical protein